MRKIMTIGVVLMTLAMLIAAAPVHATINSITDGNSTVSIDLDSQSGIFDWTVDGVDQMYQSWWWYGEAGTVGQRSVDTISASTTKLTGDQVEIDSWAGSGVKFTAVWTIVGGTAGSGVSDLAETVRLTNTSSTAKTFRLYQYADFDLNGDPYSPDSAKYVDNPRILDQWKGNVSMEQVITSGTGPTHYQIDSYPNLLNGLNGASTLTLNDTPAVNALCGPADLAYAYQWDITLAANGGTFIVSSDKSLNVKPVPEPASLSLLGLGIVGLIRRRRKA